MSTGTRIYVVNRKGDPTPRLVRATYRTTAIRHVSLADYSARVATQTDLETLITQGVRVELAADPVSDAQADEHPSEPSGPVSA